MRVREVSLVLSVRHRITHRSRRDAESIPLGYIPTASGLGLLDIGADDRLEDLLFSLCELISAHGNPKFDLRRPTFEFVTSWGASSSRHPTGPIEFDDEFVEEEPPLRCEPEPVLLPDRPALIDPSSGNSFLSWSPPLRPCLDPFCDPESEPEPLEASHLVADEFGILDRTPTLGHRPPVRLPPPQVPTSEWWEEGVCTRSEPKVWLSTPVCLVVPRLVAWACEVRDLVVQEPLLLESLTRV